MTGETLTPTLPAPLAREWGSATQDFLADLLARGLRDVKRVFSGSAMWTRLLRSALAEHLLPGETIRQIIFALGQDRPVRRDGLPTHDHRSGRSAVAGVKAQATVYQPEIWGRR